MTDHHDDATVLSADTTDPQNDASAGDSWRVDIKWPPMNGTDIGDFVLKEELGRGGMGIVYKARQKQLDRTVAIKILMGGQAASKEDLELFVSEAQTAAKVRHPNLVGVHGAGQCFGFPFFAMEYVEGTGLDAMADNGPLEADRAARLMAKVAHAVAHLHKNNIVHCDLKPANILLDADGTPFVTDFGLSKTTGGGPAIMSEGTVAGTPSYMSPEQADGRVKDTSFPSDIYSMGAILYHLLTGQRTFDNETVSELIDHVVGRLPVRPRNICPAVPPGLEAICLKCLEKDPGARYSSATALAEDIDRYVSGEPLEAQAPTLWRRFARWVLREPALAGRVISMTTLLAIEMLWYHVLGISGRRFHWAVVSLVPAWIFASFVFQRLERVRTRKYLARLFWAIADNAFLAAVLFFSAASVSSPAVICYPLLVASSGLWHSVSLVWICTVTAMTSYGLLWMEAYSARAEVVGPYDQHIVFLTGLAILGFLVARLARQIQILMGRLSR